MLSASFGPPVEIFAEARAATIAPGNNFCSPGFKDPCVFFSCNASSHESWIIEIWPVLYPRTWSKAKLRFLLEL